MFVVGEDASEVSVCLALNERISIDDSVGSHVFSEEVGDVDGSSEGFVEAVDEEGEGVAGAGVFCEGREVGGGVGLVGDSQTQLGLGVDDLLVGVYAEDGDS